MTLRKSYHDGPLGQLHVLSGGTAGKPTLIMLHQTPSAAVMYGALMEVISDDYYMIAPDLPGFGASDPLPDGDSVTGYAEQTWGALEGALSGEVHILGHHTGAAVATEIARQNPGRITSIALSGPTVFSDEIRAILPGKAETFERKRDGSHLVEMWDRIIYKDSEADLELIEREVLLAQALGDRFLDAYMAVMDYDAEAAMAELDIPVLVFAGTGDILHSALEPSMQVLKHGECTEIDAKSYLLERNVDEVAQLLREFFRRAAKI